MIIVICFFFFFSSRRRHTRSLCDWSSDVCSSDLVTRELVVTVRKTPPHCPPFGVDLPTRGRAGAIVAALADAVAEEFLNAVDALDDEVDAVDDAVESGDAAVLRGRIRSLRHQLLRVRRGIGPTREAFHRLVDKRVDVEGEELLP